MRQNIKFLKNPPTISASASVVGKKEYYGPIGKLFDFHSEDNRFGQKTWESAEAEMQHIAFSGLLKKAGRDISDVDALFAGDLINQCTSSVFGTLSFDIPYFGLYGACSTAVEGLILASMLISADYYSSAAVIASSHNSTAERQFRFPLEYGSQRTPTSQWTVTGAGAFLLDRHCEAGKAEIRSVLSGRRVDLGITDSNNMGAAMAPAAVDTLSRFFKESETKPEDYDMIITGDLGFEGYKIVTEQMKENGYNMSNYTDCGLIIFDSEAQDTHAGGSGCGCSAAVLASYLLPKIERCELSDILFVGTGALLSPMTVMQGMSIPGIAHLAEITNGAKRKG